MLCLNLIKSLPFSSKPKQQAKAKRNNYVQRRQVVLEPEEKKQRAAVQMIQTLKNDKMGKRREAGKARMEKKTKEREKHATRPNPTLWRRERATLTLCRRYVLRKNGLR